jgi:RNA polymerase-binding transcription factor DksA
MLALPEADLEPQDPADRAREEAEFRLAVSLRQHLVRVEVSEDQCIDLHGRVICLWCEEPIDAERLDAEPAAVRHECCQQDFEQWRRRHA